MTQVDVYLSSLAIVQRLSKGTTVETQGVAVIIHVDQDIVEAMRSFPTLDLYSSPERFIEITDEPSRPQPRLDRDNGKGMTVTVGRVFPDNIFDYRFVALSHNTVRGAAGAAVLNAELLIDRGII